MGMYAKYTPIRVNFDLVPNLTPSNKKWGYGSLGGHFNEDNELRRFPMGLDVAFNDIVLHFRTYSKTLVLIL